MAERRGLAQWLLANKKKTLFVLVCAAVLFHFKKDALASLLSCHRDGQQDEREACPWRATLHSVVGAVRGVAEEYPKVASLLLLVGGYSLTWLLSLPLSNASIVDSFWAFSFVLASLVYYYHPSTQTSFPGRKKLVVLLTSVWAVRLSSYITWRNFGHGEDPRYAAMRKKIGSGFWWKSYFVVFLLQAVLSWVISHPLLDAMHPSSPQTFVPTDLLATLVWGVGFFFESVSDLQLARFKANPANKQKLLTSGLWSLSRHPNYFGNACLNWGLFLFALSAKGLAGLTSVYAPLLMNYFLLEVSGVKLLEKTSIKKKPGFEAYQASTNAFLPWFPSSSKPKSS